MMSFAAFSTHQQELFLTDLKVTSESRLGAAGLELLVMMRHGDWKQQGAPDWVMPCVHRGKHFFLGSVHTTWKTKPKPNQNQFLY